MSILSQKIVDDMKTAMKAREKETLNVLRALKTAVTNAAIEKGGLGTELDDTEITAIIRKQVKQRQDSVEQFEKADRAELAEAEKAEITILQTYLPAEMTEAELSAALDAAFDETGASTRADMGKVMAILKESTQGRVDGKTLSAAVMKRLS